MGLMLWQCLPLVSRLWWNFWISSNSLLFTSLAPALPNFASFLYSFFRSVHPHICLVGPFFYELLSLFYTCLTKLTDICDAGTWVGLTLRLRSFTCTNGIYVISIVGLKSKGTPLHNSRISLFHHMYNWLRCYYCTVIGISIMSLFQKGLVTCEVWFADLGPLRNRKILAIKIFIHLFFLRSLSHLRFLYCILNSISHRKSISLLSYM